MSEAHAKIFQHCKVFAQTWMGFQEVSEYQLYIYWEVVVLSNLNMSKIRIQEDCNSMVVIQLKQSDQAHPKRRDSFPQSE